MSAHHELRHRQRRTHRHEGDSPLCAWCSGLPGASAHLIFNSLTAEQQAACERELELATTTETAD